MKFSEHWNNQAHFNQPAHFQDGQYNMAHQNMHYHHNQPYNQPNQPAPANMMGQPPGHPVSMIQSHGQLHRFWFKIRVF